MIGVEKACEIATTERNEPFVDVITDIGSGSVIGTMAEDGEVAEMFPVLIYEDSGKVETFRVPEHIEEIKNGKQIKIPSKYRFKA